MSDKGHFYISILKSLIRIVGSFIALWYNSISILAGSFAAAEVLGIFEEIFDKR